MIATVRIEKLVHGGQGIGKLPDGKKVFMWNVLPGEQVAVRLTKQKRDYAEGVVEEVLEASPERVEPVDEAYLSTSPWQMMSFEAENWHKQTILRETFSREGLDVGAGIPWIVEGPELGYRNKMEYSFWGDDDGLHLALFHRGSKGKRIVSGSSIAKPEIDEATHRILAVLRGANVRASQLKTVVLRSSRSGEVVAALFVKDEAFSELQPLGDTVKGLAVYYSNPKNPASIITKQLYRYGDIMLTDTVSGTSVRYDVDSFFQVNLPPFEHALRAIRQAVADRRPVVDLYSGVGTIGIPIGADVLIESDEHNVARAKENIAGRPIRIIHTPAEAALDAILPEGSLIVDPPRAGLHRKLTDFLAENGPSQLIYLSCNPVTQARDLALLRQAYRLQSVAGYNFFPRTPHIESLAIMERR